MAGRLASTGGRPQTARRDDDLESVVSFADGPTALRPTVKHAWSADQKVNHDSFQKMLDEYRSAKATQKDDQLKIKQLAAQLARTEEAAKRAMLRSDSSARGGAAQQLLDAEREMQKLRADNAELSSKLAREKKRASDWRQSAQESKQRLEAALKEQRALVQRLGAAERGGRAGASAGGSKGVRSGDEELLSEEAGRRFAVQQEELVNLREANVAMQEKLAKGVPQETVARYETQLHELTHLVRFYEKKLGPNAGGAGAGHHGGAGGAAGEDDAGTWQLEELVENGVAYLWDRRNGRVYSDAPEGRWPKLVGTRTTKGPMQPCTRARRDTLLASLEDLLKTQRAPLADAFKTLDRNGDGTIHKSDMPALLAGLLGGSGGQQAVGQRDLAELCVWLDAEGSEGEGIRLEALTRAIGEALSAREAARLGRTAVMNEALARVRRALREDLSKGRHAAAAAWSDLGSGRDGALGHLEVVALVKQLVPDLNRSEARFLLAALNEWDATGEAKLPSLTDLYALLQLATLQRCAPGQGSADRPSSRASSKSNSTTIGSATIAGMQSNTLKGTGSTVAGHRSQQEGPRGPDRQNYGGATGGPQGGGLAEAYLRERVAAQEAELAELRRVAATAGAAGTGKGTATVDPQQLDTLRREVARYQARVGELEADFLSLDVMANTDLSEYDAEMRKAWYTASAFKKRYMEHKVELDNIKATYDKMSRTLDETHKQLHEESRRRFAAEDEAARARIEAGRSKDLAAQISNERAERMKLEKEYLELQTKAFAAPGSALGEVRQLREELLGLRRERALAQQKEAELRKELQLVKRAMEGVSAEDYRTLQRDLAEAQRKLTASDLELRAAQDKLEVYRRTEAPDGTVVLHGKQGPAGGMDGGGGSSLVALGNLPDADKSEGEVRRELRQLREVYALEQAEVAKMRKLLDTEAAISTEAKAAIEEAHRKLQAQKSETAAELARLRREIDAKEERIRALELQLKGAYGGLNKALQRANRAGVGASTTQVPDESDERLLSELGANENVLELCISEATFSEDALPGGADASTFFTWDFFLHDSQATRLVAGPTPTYDAQVQYVVEADAFFVEYLDTRVLELELHAARGWESRRVGVARVALRQVLEDLEVGAALGANRAYHHANIYGATGDVIGRLRYGFSVKRPMDTPVAEYRARVRGAQPSVADMRDPAAVAAAQAEANPATASHLRVTIHRCEGLPPAPGAPPGGCRPYAHYRVPGHTTHHDTSIAAGALPVWEDEARWGLVRSEALEKDLATRTMEVAVFDDAAGADAAGALLGVASVPLANLALGVPVEGAFRLAHPTTKQPAGKVWLSISWANPMDGPMGSSGYQMRAPLADAQALSAAAAMGQQLLARVVEASPAGTPVKGQQQQGQQCGQQWQSQQGQGQQGQQWQGQQGGQQAFGRAQSPQREFSGFGAHSAGGSELQPQAQSPLRQQQQNDYIPEVGTPPALTPIKTTLTAASHGLPLQPPPQLGMAQQMQMQAARPSTCAGSQQGQQQQAATPWQQQQQQQQHLSPAGYGLGAEVAGQQPGSVPGSMLLQSVQGLGSSGLAAAVGRPRYQEGPDGASPRQQQQQQQQQGGAGPQRQQQPPKQQQQQQQQPGAAQPTGPILRRCAPEPEHWTSYDTTIYLRIDSLELSSDAMSDRSVSNVLIAHMLLEDFTDAAQQCTNAVAKRPGAIGLNSAVAYSLGAPGGGANAAGRALAGQLGVGGRVVVPVLLATSADPNVKDFGQVDCIGTCEVDLSSLWAGSSQDIICREFNLVPSPDRRTKYPSGSAGVVKLTLVAARALAALKAGMRQGQQGQQAQQGLQGQGQQKQQKQNPAAATAAALANAWEDANQSLPRH